MNVVFVPPPVEENKFETQVRCMSTKIPIKFEREGDTINTAKNLWYTYSSIRVVEAWIGRTYITVQWSMLQCSD